MKIKPRKNVNRASNFITPTRSWKNSLSLTHSEVRKKQLKNLTTWRQKKVVRLLNRRVSNVNKTRAKKLRTKSSWVTNKKKKRSKVRRTPTNLLSRTLNASTTKSLQEVQALDTPRILNHSVRDMGRLKWFLISGHDFLFKRVVIRGQTIKRDLFQFKTFSITNFRKFLNSYDASSVNTGLQILTSRSRKRRVFKTLKTKRTKRIRKKTNRFTFTAFFRGWFSRNVFYKVKLGTVGKRLRSRVKKNTTGILDLDLAKQNNFKMRGWSRPKLRMRLFKRLPLDKPLRYLRNFTKPYTWASNSTIAHAKRQKHILVAYFQAAKKIKKAFKRVRSPRKSLTHRHLTWRNYLITKSDKLKSRRKKKNFGHHLWSKLSPKIALTRPLLMPIAWSRKLNLKSRTLRRRLPFARDLVLFKAEPFYIEPKHLTSYLFRSLGFHLVSKTFRHKFTWDTMYVRKKLSFFFAGEFKKELMRKKKKTRFESLLFNIRKRLNFSNPFSLEKMNSNFKSFFRRQIITQSAQRNLLLETTSSSMTQISRMFNFKIERDNLHNKLLVESELLEQAVWGSELRLPRIRFKPGYQRIWRHAREALKEALGLRFLYQKQLTTYLGRFYGRFKHYRYLNENRVELQQALLYTHLFPDLDTASLYIDESAVFLNGNPVDSLSSILVINDFIQVTVSNWFYTMNRWVTNWATKRVDRFKRLVFMKNKAYQYRVIKRRKKKSYYIPNWIFNYKLDTLGIKQYFEVDFFTLSAFVIFYPSANFYENWRDDLHPRVDIYRMYNWKYIT